MSRQIATRVMIAMISCVFCSSCAAVDPLESGFSRPPASTRPGIYWYWINDNITKDGITKDLESMSRVGIGRAYIGQIFNHDPENNRTTPTGDTPFMSEGWWDAMQWAVKEAGRLDIEIGFFNGPGWSQSGGPWIDTSESMRYLSASETVVEGGRQIEQTLPIPPITTFPRSGGARPIPTGDRFTAEHFQDVGVIAFPQPSAEYGVTRSDGFEFTSTDIGAVANLRDEDPTTTVRLNQTPRQLLIRNTDRAAVRTLEIVPSANRFTLTCRIAVSDDGESFRPLHEHVEERGHQGPRTTDALRIPLPATTSPFLRVTLTARQRVDIAELRVSGGRSLAHYIRKQLGEVSPSSRPPWRSYMWPEQPALSPGSEVPHTDVIDLTASMTPDGTLTWDAPPGRWVVMRLGMLPIGVQSHPTSAESRGFEVDKMNRAHIRNHFDAMVGEFLRRTPEADRTALKFVIADSYETGPQNWTDGFLDTFEDQYGYSPLRYLPVLNGRVVDSPDISDRFLWDWRRLVAESIATEYVGGLREVANENDLILWLENYGHWGFPSEFLLYGSMSDQVGGEFWENAGIRWNSECRAASSSAHTYGRNDVYAEAFTSFRNFKQSPASLKPYADWVFSTGVNHLILHVMLQQTDDRAPGIIQWFGTAFNRHNTWFEQSKAFVDYIRRCSFMLKAGNHVADVAYYIGEGAPVMQGPRMPFLPAGYDYDFINADVLLNRATVADGRITLPGGASYAALVLPPQEVMRPRVMQRLAELVEAGATVMGPKPAASPSLENHPHADTEIRALADRLWIDASDLSDGESLAVPGRIVSDASLEQLLLDLGVTPDVIITSEQQLPFGPGGTGAVGVIRQGGVVFTHRSMEDCEIYFIANTTTRPIDFQATFRVTGLQPELWDAVDGRTRDATAFWQTDGTTRLPLELAESESVFVVFREPIAKRTNGTTESNSTATKPVTDLTGPWDVSFDGVHEPVDQTFLTLVDLAQHEDEDLRHFAGTATYTTTAHLSNPSDHSRLTLQLGELGIIGEVFVNGQFAGSAWTAPWEVDITNLAVPGPNRIEIRVATRWHNRLVADAALPPEERASYVSEPYRFNPGGGLLKSGLLGPVQIVAE